jgi:DNA-damage-inducible protein D
MGHWKGGAIMASSGHHSAFERIRQEDEEGGEFWSARDLADILEYTQWRNFRLAIEKAQTACEASGYAVPDHFAGFSKMVTLGSGAERAIEDWRLSRYACYLIVQNADPAKAIVALGQTYFAMQTRRQELADQAAVERWDEDTRRLKTCEQLTRFNKELAATAQGAGVVTPMDFAISRIMTTPASTTASVPATSPPARGSRAARRSSTM